MPTPARSLASEPSFPDAGLQVFAHHQWLVGRASANCAACRLACCATMADGGVVLAAGLLPCLAGVQAWMRASDWFER
jgi:hypothetical protein